MITNVETTGLEVMAGWMGSASEKVFDQETLREILKASNVSFVAEGINRFQSTLLCELKDSYVQQSQRYVTMKEDGYILPDLDEEDQVRAKALIDESFKLYQEMSKLHEGEFKGRPKLENYYYGIPVEDARYILPLVIKTNITVAMSGDKLIDLYRLMNDIRYAGFFVEMKEELNRYLPTTVVEALEGLSYVYPDEELTEGCYKEQLERIMAKEPMVLLSRFDNLDLKVGLGALTSTMAKCPSEVLANWGDEALVKAQGVADRVMGYGHTSIAEQARTTFGMMCSLVTYHQQERHRLTANYREAWTNLIDDMEREFVVPPTIKDSTFAECYCKLVEEYRVFRKELQAKYSGGQEYGFLLNCDQVKLIISSNARMDIGMLGERICFNAQWEIRELSTKKLQVLRELSPVLYERALPSCALGKCREGKLSCGRAAEVRQIFNIQ